MASKDPLEELRDIFFTEYKAMQGEGYGRIFYFETSRNTFDALKRRVFAKGKLDEIIIQEAVREEWFLFAKGVIMGTLYFEEYHICLVEDNSLPFRKVILRKHEHSRT